MGVLKSVKTVTILNGISAEMPLLPGESLKLCSGWKTVFERKYFSYMFSELNGDYLKNCL